MPIRYFEIVGEVIRDDINHMVTRTGKPIDIMYQEIVAHLRNMTIEWYKIIQPNIQYDDPMCRLAYLYAHVPANSNLFGVILDTDPELRTKIITTNQEKGIVDICAFGGGPGSELLGLCKTITCNIPK